ncbi:MAG TPA: amino acid ABC transporter permease [Tissierellia bacterium]|nr:amino acid ABC transporter permease [Tissierellia bacterium]
MTLILDLLPPLLRGLRMTLFLSSVVWLISIPLSVLTAFLRMSRSPVLSNLTKAYIYVMKGTPLLLQLFFVYFGLPYLGIAIERLLACFVAFILNYTAYFAEIVRGGLQSIDRGQIEAAKVLGIRRTQRFFYIILPQLTKIVLPSIANESATLIKDSSLIYVIGVGELLRAGKIAVNTLASIIPFLLVALIYLIVITIVNIAFDAFEKRFSYY